MQTGQEAHATARERHSSRTRLVVGLSAFGYAAAFLTGCTQKTPDQQLCHDATQVYKEAGAPDTDELVPLAKEDPAKLAEIGQGFREAAEKNEGSKYAEMVDLTGRIFESLAGIEGEIDPKKADPAKTKHLAELIQQAELPETKLDSQRFKEKCPALYSDSEYSESVGLMGKMLVTASRLDKDPDNQELQNELKSAAEQAAKPGVAERADEFGDKCPALAPSGS